jgi:hypothetical protein
MKAIVVLLALGACPAWAQVAISPKYLQLVPDQAASFTATGGPVIWQVNNVVGGNAASGTITGGGAFTAPATLPSPAAVTVTAVSAADSSQTATATITLIATAASGTTYYLSTTGSDSNPGTITAPFATLQHAASVAVAGDTVLARQGVYKALFTPTHSGTAAQGPITFASYPGELATIDGTGLAIPNGMNGLVTLNNLSNVIVEGFDIRNYTTSSINQVPIGIFVSGAGSNVQVVNNHIHAITTTAKTNATACGSNAFGMTVYGTQAPAAITGLVISGNELDHLLTGCSETLSVDGNVDGFLIASNLIHDDNNIGIGAIGYEKVSPNSIDDRARNGVIRGNLVYNITSFGNPDYGNQYAADGIYVDGGTQIVIEQNVVHNVDLGIEMTSEHGATAKTPRRYGDHITARNNLVYDGNSAGISIGGYGPARGGSQYITIVNNTLFNNDTKNTDSGEFQIQYYATNNVFENNIVYAGAQGLLVHNFTRSEKLPAVLNNNLYYGAAGTLGAHFVWDGTGYTGFKKYTKGAMQDALTTFADPLFLSTVTPDLDLQPGSPALNAGVNLGASVIGTVDAAGNPRVSGSGAVSIGAYQQ